MIKAARSHDLNVVRQSRDGRVRDAVRERDAERINEAVLTIVAEATEKMAALRKQKSRPDRELEEAEEVVDWGIRTFGSYVGACIELTGSCTLMDYDLFKDVWNPD